MCIVFSCSFLKHILPQTVTNSSAAPPPLPNKSPWKHNVEKVILHSTLTWTYLLWRTPRSWVFCHQKHCTEACCLLTKPHPTAPAAFSTNQNIYHHMVYSGGEGVGDRGVAAVSRVLGWGLGGGRGNWKQTSGCLTENKTVAVSFFFPFQKSSSRKLVLMWFLLKCVVNNIFPAKFENLKQRQRKTADDGRIPSPKWAYFTFFCTFPQEQKVVMMKTSMPKRESVLPFWVFFCSFSSRTKSGSVQTRARHWKDMFSHQLVSADRFLKLPVICSPDLDQLVCRCKDKSWTSLVEEIIIMVKCHSAFCPVNTNCVFITFLDWNAQAGGCSSSKAA